VPDVLLRQPVDTGRELQLGGSLNLGVDAAEVVDDVDESIGRCARAQKAPGEPPCQNLVPAD
jgi:hypothetical protein